MNNENNMNNLGANPLPTNNVPENNMVPPVAPNPVNPVNPVNSAPVNNPVGENPTPSVAPSPVVTNEVTSSPVAGVNMDDIPSVNVSSEPVSTNEVTSNPTPTVENLEETIELNPSMQSMAVENLDETKPLETTSASYDNSSYNEFADEKPKKKSFSPLTIVLVLLVLAVAGVGAWYFFVYSKGTNNSGKQPFKIKDVVIELGDEIPTNITYYANQNLSQSEYRLKTNNINNNVVGDYEYTVTYNGTTYTGKASVKDTTKPVLKVNNKVVSDVTELSITELISECKDLSSCNYRFKDANALDNIKGKGTYELAIVAYDEYGNEETATSLITVNAENEYEKIVCTKDIKSSKYAATINNLITVSFNENALYRLKEETTYTFENLDELNKYLKNNPDDPGTSDMKANTFYYVDIYTSTDLNNSNAKKDIPQNKEGALNFFKNSGYECK